MNFESYLERITVDPNIMTGKPIIRGLRITVDQILKSLAAGIEKKDILQDYPELEEDDIKACLIYAASLVEEERVYPVKTSL